MGEFCCTIPHTLLAFAMPHKPLRTTSKHVVFGRTVDGIKVVRALERVETDAYDKVCVCML